MKEGLNFGKNIKMVILTHLDRQFDLVGIDCVPGSSVEQVEVIKEKK